MSYLKANSYQIRFPVSVRPSARLLDGVWHLLSIMRKSYSVYSFNIHTDLY